MQLDQTRVALSLAEAATAAGLSRSRLYELLADGTGPKSFKVGRRRLVRVAALREWLRGLEAEQNGGEVAGE